MAFSLETYRVVLQGETPLLMNNGSIAPNPLHSISKLKKQFTGKRKKSDDDLNTIATLEWYTALYLDGEHEVILSDEDSDKDIITFGESKVTMLGGNIVKAMIVSAGKKNRRGTAYKESLKVSPVCDLKFDGNPDPNLMFQQSRFIDVRPVVVQRSRLMRTRPRIPNWELSFDLSFFSDVLNVAEIKESLDIAGNIIGLCDFRPACGGDFGMFSVTEFDKI